MAQDLPPTPNAQVLGQLLLMQSVVSALPDTDAIYDFVCRGLGDIPGVAGARLATLDREATDETPARLLRLPLQSGGVSHGELMVTLSDAAAFLPYEAHLSNFTVALAVMLEERRQRRLNEQHAAELEQRFEERTRQLLHEIEERRCAEEGVSLFRALIDQSNDAFEVVDPVTARILDVNQRRCLDLGYSREEYLSLRVFDIDPMVEPATFQQTMTELRRSGTLLWSGAHRRKDGSTFPVEVNLRLVRLEREYLLAAVRDVSERKRAEEQSRKFMLGVTRSSDAIFLTDRDGTITFVNPAFERLYGFSRAEALGQTPRILKSGERDPEFYASFWQTLMANRVVQVEMANQTKDGRIVHVDGSANPIVDDAGAIVGFLAIQRDITERKQAAEHRSKLEEQLRAA